MIGAIVRFVVSALVLLFLGFLLPGFRIVGFLNALIAAAVIALLGYLVENVAGRRVSPYSRGLIGFLVGAAVIYGAQWVVPTMRVSVVGALLASLIIGLVDAFLPTDLR
ncbi:MAG: phage holin family protein [Clostridia bacterium]|nr:phage holin family protein [Clostridia bacterium]